MYTHTHTYIFLNLPSNVDGLISRHHYVGSTVTGAEKV